MAANFKYKNVKGIFFFLTLIFMVYIHLHVFFINKLVQATSGRVLLHRHSERAQGYVPNHIMHTRSKQ